MDLQHFFIILNLNYNNSMMVIRDKNNLRAIRYASILLHGIAVDLDF